MSAPTLEEVTAYLTSIGISKPEADVESARLTELSNQASVCDMPAADEEWPADLAEALCRRVAVNLGVRPVTLGVQTSITEAAFGAVRVGGGDREVDRLEGPFRTIAIA